jgi:hypothetical protein
VGCGRRDKRRAVQLRASAVAIGAVKAMKAFKAVEAI